MTRDPSDSGAESAKTIVAGISPPSLTARTRGVLTLLSGTEVGRVVSVPPGVGVKLGRSDDCTVRFEDGSLSRVHASVICVGGISFVLKDNESTNGSFVNDARVTFATPLKDGDRIQLGTATTLRFSLVDEGEEAALKRVFEAARRDGLTGVANRKSFEERLDAEYAFAVRHQSHLCLTILDVDHFKKVNDTHGHPAGDTVLRAVASCLAAGVRTEDVVARFGGEEFAVIARGIELNAGKMMAERLRGAIHALEIPVETSDGKPVLRVTVSAGVATLACSPNLDRSALVSLADVRLYKAKQSGRNRVVAST